MVTAGHGHSMWQPHYNGPEAGEVGPGSSPGAEVSGIGQVGWQRKEVSEAQVQWDVNQHIKAIKQISRRQIRALWQAVVFVQERLLEVALTAEQPERLGASPALGQEEPPGPAWSGPAGCLRAAARCLHLLRLGFEWPMIHWGSDGSDPTGASLGTWRGFHSHSLLPKFSFTV